MRNLLVRSAVVLGVVGVLVCATAVGIGWWAVGKTTARLDRIAARLDHGLSVVEMHTARVESRLNAVRADLNAIRGAAEKIAAEIADRPRVRAELDQLLDRLDRTFDRADALADLLRSAAAGLRIAADFVDQFSDDPEATVRSRTAADKIDGAAESLNGLRARVEALKVATAVHVTHELVALTRAAIASSERIAEGLTAVRLEIADVRGRAAVLRNETVTWLYVGAAAYTLAWLWGGLGQLCLIGWGRRRYDRPPARG